MESTAQVEERAETYVVKYFTKNLLRLVNKLALKNKCNAIEPKFLDQLPDGLIYPVLRKMPWERSGWVRCMISVATSLPAVDIHEVILDVPQEMFNTLPTKSVSWDK